MKRIHLPAPWWCAVAVAVSVLSMLATLVHAVRLRLNQGTPVAIVFSEGRPEPLEDGDEVSASEWMPPVGRPGELFTPSHLVYDAATNRFVVPSLPSVPSSGGHISTLIEVLEVRAELYPVQLVGYAGSGATLRGIFEVAASGESVVARAGDTFAGLGLTVELVQVRRAAVSPAEGAGSPRRHAIAVLRDALSGERIELSSTERHLSAPPVALAKVRREDRTLELREDETFAVHGRTYRVRALHLRPAGVEVESVDGERILLPARSGSESR